MSPLKCRLMSSDGTSCDRPPPVPPPFMPRYGPSEGSRSAATARTPFSASPCASPTDVVVFPSPAGVGVIADTRIKRPCGSRPSRAASAIFPLKCPYGSRCVGEMPSALATSAMGFMTTHSTDPDDAGPIAIAAPPGVGSIVFFDRVRCALRYSRSSRSRDQEQTRRHGDGSDGPCDALTAWRETLDADGRRDGDHRAQVHDADGEENRHQVSTTASTMESETHTVPPRRGRIGSQRRRVLLAADKLT